MTIDTNAARSFVYSHGRLLEQRVYESVFDGASPAHVVRAVAAYQNDDGGFGHGLEPDKRAPASQPLDVEVALSRLVSAGATTAKERRDVADMAARACDFLVTVTSPSGAVPVLLPTITGYPRAAHWAETSDYPPGMNPTAGIAANLIALGVDHPWVATARDYCLGAVEAQGAPTEAHTLVGLTKLIEQCAGDPRAAALARQIGGAIPSSSFFLEVPDGVTYGVTPLQFAPSPETVARSWFGDETIAANLDELEASQADDGGWTIRWDAPSEASRCEWRAIATLDALMVLVAYGRVPNPPTIGL
jgi:hypothetical protein